MNMSWNKEKGITVSLLQEAQKKRDVSAVKFYSKQFFIRRDMSWYSLDYTLIIMNEDLQCQGHLTKAILLLSESLCH